LLAFLYRKLGALEALKVFVEVQLGEYRAIFEGIGILSANTFPALMESCSEFKECYKLFLSCQGTIVEVSGRIASVKDRCSAANLPARRPAHNLSHLVNSNGIVASDSLSASDDVSVLTTTTASVAGLEPIRQQRLTGEAHAVASSATQKGTGISSTSADPPQSQSMSIVNELKPVISVSVSTDEHDTNTASLADTGSNNGAVSNRKKSMLSTKSAAVPFAQELQNKLAVIDTLQQQLKQFQTEADQSKLRIEDLELEVIAAHEENDRTPGALIFYATLSDPFAISSFKALYEVLATLKGFVNCAEHVDFPTVRKRLKQCLSYIPVVERFVSRYDMLHKRWTSKRMGTYLDRGLGGSAADSSFICPICDCDRRLDPSVQASLGPVPYRLGISPQKVLKPYNGSSLGISSSASVASMNSSQSVSSLQTQSQSRKQRSSNVSVQSHGSQGSQCSQATQGNRGMRRVSNNSDSSVPGVTLPPMITPPVAPMIAIPVPVPMSSAASTPMYMPPISGSPVVSVSGSNLDKLSKIHKLNPALAAGYSSLSGPQSPLSFQQYQGPGSSSTQLELFSPMRLQNMQSLQSLHSLQSRSGSAGSIPSHRDEDVHSIYDIYDGITHDEPEFELSPSQSQSQGSARGQFALMTDSLTPSVDDLGHGVR
jgi:hypothetical protein